MKPEELHETPDNDRLVLRLFRRGDDTAEIARRFQTTEAAVARMLARAREAERAETVEWQNGSHG
jgi:transcriptional regulator